MQNETSIWRKCSSCKKPIAHGIRYYSCSVSTCNGQRTGYVFCSVPCWEVHLPGARHKDAAAIEMKSPASAMVSSRAAVATESVSSPTRRIVASPTGNLSGAPAGPASKQPLPREVLIIASRLKEYIGARSEMNTSAQVMDVLSDFVRIACDRAIENARAEGRKTVLDRDFRFLRNS